MNRSANKFEFGIYFFSYICVPHVFWTSWSSSGDL